MAAAAAGISGGGAAPLAEPPALLAEQSFPLDRPLREARDDFERAYFEFHLAREGGSMTRVADKTGLERTHLYRKLKQLGVDWGRGGRRAQGAPGLAAQPSANPGDLPAADDDED